MSKAAEQLRSKKVAVLGLGQRSGVPLVRFLLEQGAEVTVLDQRPREGLQDALAMLVGLPVRYELGPTYLSHLQGFDIIYKTPIMRPDLPELLDAQAQGAVLSSETELFCELCPAPITAVTGSDGKTTTTSLIAAMFRAAGKTTYLGGNIGNSLIELVTQITPTDAVVLELSSFQLMPMHYSPHIAVVTNVSPNHLDVHKDYYEYIAAKAVIWQYQKPGDRTIVNFDNSITRQMGESIAERAVYFSRLSDLDEGVFWAADRLIARWAGREHVLCRVDDLKLRGAHNQENVAAAAAACLVQGVAVEAISQTIREFDAVTHRLELVRELGGVKFYNDSIASSPTRTIAGIEAIGGDIVLIAGGYDKLIPFDELARVIVDRVRAVALIGKTAQKIAEAITLAEANAGKKVEMAVLPTLQAAVTWCYERARTDTHVLLSPACASFDMFRDFEDRGRQFKALVNEL